MKTLRAIRSFRGFIKVKQGRRFINVIRSFRFNGTASSITEYKIRNCQLQFGLVDHQAASSFSRERDQSGGSLTPIRNNLKCKERTDIVSLSVDRVTETARVELARPGVMSVYNFDNSASCVKHVKNIQKFLNVLASQLKPNTRGADEQASYQRVNPDEVEFSCSFHTLISLLQYNLRAVAISCCFKQNKKRLPFLIHLSGQRYRSCSTPEPGNRTDILDSLKQRERPKLETLELYVKQAERELACT
ncbi:hypothetical protein EVAR_69141_1 [Eumeta japonica]|uniref:Uncharacterized protein n=1 Tax=Eumeta variegata TaxID=151549 RepID=A0A4C2A2M2_EUMVA|nr:hypothetical protein EVAR_69141_1 [Eumeta japonica]